MKYVDLHIHTYYSDGVDTPLQVIRASKMKGLDMIAIADHDNLRGYFRGLKEAKRLGIDLVPAVEITTIEHHLLALNFQPEDKRFKEYVEYSKDVHEEVCGQRVDLLKDYGVPINFDKVKTNFPSASLGKYSILWTMLMDDECRKFIEEKNKGQGFQELFSFYLGRSGVAGKVPVKRAIKWGQTVYEVKRAGGLVIIPHPGKDFRLPSEIEWMLTKVDGVELQPRFKKEALPFIEYAKEKGKIITYGSYYHSTYGSSQILSKGENCIEDALANQLRR